MLETVKIGFEKIFLKNSGSNFEGGGVRANLEKKLDFFFEGFSNAKSSKKREDFLSEYKLFVFPGPQSELNPGELLTTVSTVANSSKQTVNVIVVNTKPLSRINLMDK